MSSRKNFLRNCLMAAAISVLPKSLLPSMGKIEEDIYDGKRVYPFTMDEVSHWPQLTQSTVWYWYEYDHFEKKGKTYTTNVE